MTTATEVTLAIPDTTELAKDQVNVVDLATAFVVDSQNSLDKAAVHATRCKTRMKAADDLLGPSVTKAHEAHKAAKGVWNTLTKPNQQAYDIYRKKMGDYVHEEERKARAEQQRKEAEARKIEEDRVAAEAEQLAKDDRVEEAVVLIDKPVCVAVPAPVKTKAVGMSTQKNYKWRLINRSKIPEQYKLLHEVLINQVVRTHHEAAADMIPGIEVYTETGVSMRSA